MNHYHWLLSRLDAFIHKYYLNQLIRGVLLLLTCIGAYILLVSVGEYFLYLPVAARMAIAAVFIGVGGFALVALIGIPLLRLSRLGKTLSREEAAVIVGRHFPEISDKLLNVLQLSQDHSGAASRELIEASIDQKAKQLQPIPITRAIDLTRNKKYLAYLIPVLLIGTLILIVSPGIFSEASTRLLSPATRFEKPAPFTFGVSGRLQAVYNSDYKLTAFTQGSVMPLQMNVVVNGDAIPMESVGNGRFEYTFHGVTDNVVFHLNAGGFDSRNFTLSVAQKPRVSSLRMNIHYPAYTRKPDETRNSLGDMQVPEGTQISWTMQAKNADLAQLVWAGGSPSTIARDGDRFSFQMRLMQDTGFSVRLTNAASGLRDESRYNIKVVKDQHPVIQLQQQKDSVTAMQVLLTGSAGDDYAVSKVLFHYDLTDSKNHPVQSKSVLLSPGGNSLVNFSYYFDISQLRLQPGQKISYYVEAWDNDGVHGSKSTRSEVMSFFNYSRDQIDSAIQQNSQMINSGLSQSARETKQLNNDLKDMQSKILDANQELDFQNQEHIRDLAGKQEQLKNELEQIKRRFEEQKQQTEQKKYSEDLQAKQEEVKKQLDNLLNNELKEQMKKLQELMQKMNKEQALKTMQQMEQENKLFNMDLERMQELMKQMELQMRLEDLANKMDQLADKQLELKDKTDAGKAAGEQLKKEQDQLKQQLDKAMKEDMKEAKDAAQKAKQQEAGMEQNQQEGKDAQEQMQQSEESLEQNQKSQSSKSQSKAAQNLKQMASRMRQQAGGMNMEQIDMDIKAVRMILSNLIRLSFDQENLMKEVQKTSPASNAYLTNIETQKRLHRNSVLIRDSLFVLSKRLFKLKASINKETTELEHNMQSATDALENRRTMDAATREQYIMTHANNLALMLNEMLANLMQMQSQAQQQQPGSGSCNKPGGAKPKPGMGQQLSDIITKQQGLSGSMQGQSGKKPGQGEGSAPGESGSKTGQGGSSKDGENGLSSEQAARFAQQQAAIRRQLQQLQSELSSKGINVGKELKEIQDKMDHNETDLVNKRFTAEMQQRQRDILTRLLETEKAVREQEQDDKRSSRSAQEIARPVPAELQQQAKDRQLLLDYYKTVPPQLKPYYKSMVEGYYRQIGK